MKFLFNFCVLLCCIVGALSQTTQSIKEKQQKELELRRALRICILENKVTYTVAIQYVKGDFKDTSDKAKCFLKCFAMKMKLVDSETFDPQQNELIGLAPYLTSEPLDFPQIIDTCQNEIERDDNQCDFVFRMYKCFWDGIRISSEADSFRLSFYDVFGFNELYDGAEIKAELEAEAQAEKDAEQTTDANETGEVAV